MAPAGRGPKGAIVGGSTEMMSLSPKGRRDALGPPVVQQQEIYPPQYIPDWEARQGRYQSHHSPVGQPLGFYHAHHEGPDEDIYEPTAPELAFYSSQGPHPGPQHGYYSPQGTPLGPQRNFYSPQGGPAGPPDGSYPPQQTSSEPPQALQSPEQMVEEKGLPNPKERIKSKRHCRDIPFLVFFLAFWVGMIINSSWAWNKGNPRRLLYGIDYQGHLCEGHFDVRYWMNPNQVYDGGAVDNPLKLINARSICLRGCPSPSTNGSLSYVCDYPEGTIDLSRDQWAAQNYDYFNLLNAEQKNSTLSLQGPCYPVLFSSSNLFWTCQLQSSANNASLQEWNGIGGAPVNQGDAITKGIRDLLNKPGELLKRYVADLGNAWPVLVVCGGIAPFLLSITFLILVRLFVGVIIWIIIAVLNIALIAVTVWFYIKAGWIGNDAVSSVIGDNAANSQAFDSSPKLQKDLKIVAVIMTIVAVIVLLITIVLIRRIYLAVAVLKVSAKSFAAIPSLIIFPFFPALILGVFLIYWVSVFLYIFSAGEIVQNTCDNGCCAYDLASSTIKCNGCCGFEFHHSKNFVWSLLFHFFGGFWTSQFIIACSLTIVAGAVVSYYWVRGDTSQLPTFPVLSSTKRLFRYSLGSMAIGSFLVAVIEMIRFVLEAIRKRIKLLEAAPGGCCISILCCCAQCYLGCIEWIIKFINRNAYIVIAVKGKGFFGAAAKASGLIVNNILRVATVNIIGDFILFLGKVSVGVSSTLFAVLMLEQHRFKYGKDKVSSPLFPALFTWLFAYTIASVFFGVVEMAIDTILLSFCIDSEENNGTPRYAPPLLLDTLSKHTRSEEEKEAKKGLR